MPVPKQRQGNLRPDFSAEPEEIEFVSSTSTGLSIIAAGIKWEAGDNVIIADAISLRTFARG